MTHTPPTDYDSPWKEILETYFPAFMAFFFPQAYEDIDWSRGYEFLDKELQQIVRDAELGRRLADKLIKVWLKDGTETWILIHIEVQGQRETDFAQRMYIYNYRLFDRYRRPVISLAVLADENPHWRPDHYGYERWGCRAGLWFPVIKVLDYKDRWAELEQSDNPFAVVVMAHLQTQATRQAPEERLVWKLRLVKRLYHQGWARQDVLELFRFIDWLMVLPEDLDQQFEAQLVSYEEERKMKYVTTIERRATKRGLEQGLERGLQQGLLQSTREDLIEVLVARFGQIPPKLVETINRIDDLPLLKHLLKRAVTIESLAAFEQIERLTAWTEQNQDSDAS